MHYMAGAWLHRMEKLEAMSKHAILDNGKTNPLFKDEYVEQLIEDYNYALSQFRYWQAQA